MKACEIYDKREIETGHLTALVHPWTQVLLLQMFLVPILQ